MTGYLNQFTVRSAALIYGGAEGMRTDRFISFNVTSKRERLLEAP
jgi:hypothetical protein